MAAKGSKKPPSTSAKPPEAAKPTKAPAKGKPAKKPA